MILIGEELNVMSKKLAQAMKERDAGPIRECIAEQEKNKSIAERYRNAEAFCRDRFRKAMPPAVRGFEPYSLSRLSS
jgi:hypothetical protein